MISLLQQPGAVSFARNPMVYELQSDALYAAAGASYAGLLSFADYSFSGYTFQLNYGDQQLIFTVPLIGSADDSGYLLPSPLGRTPEQFMADVLAVFQSNYLLERDFSIRAYNANGQLYIRFEAKQPGSTYNLSIPDTTHVSVQLLGSGADRTAQPNFKLLVEVWMQKQDSPDYEQLSRAFPEVDAEGKCTIDVAGTVADGLTAGGFDRPSLALPAVQLCTGSVRRFYLKIAEVWGDKQTIRAITLTAVKTALYGGFSKRMREQLAFPAYFKPLPLLKFLDQELPVKVTRMQQPEFLTFCAFYQALPQVKLTTTIVYNDGTTATFFSQTLTDVAQYTKVCFPAGYSQLNIGLYSNTKTVSYYTCVLQGQGGQILSEIRTFRMDYTYRPYGRYLVYQNSFGAYVSSFTYGKASREYDLTFQSSEITPAGGFRLLQGEKLDYDQRVSPKLSLATGFMSRRALQCYQDLMLSVDKFLIDKGRALPVTILSKSIKEFKDGDNLYALGFDLGFQWSEELYTYDPDEPEPYSPADLSNYVPPTEDHSMPVNFDDRYYLKTETYNQIEVDAKVAAEIATRQGQVDALTNEITALNLALGGKSNNGHVHDDRYYTKAEINDFLIGITGAVVLEYQAGQPAPILFNNWQASYAGSLGNYPTVIVLEQSADDPLLYRASALLPDRLYNGAKDQLLQLSIDAPQADDGTLRNTLQIILKA